MLLGWVVKAKPGEKGLNRRVCEIADADIVRLEVAAKALQVQRSGKAGDAAIVVQTGLRQRTAVRDSLTVGFLFGSLSSTLAAQSGSYTREVLLEERLLESAALGLGQRVPS